MPAWDQAARDVMRVGPEVHRRRDVDQQTAAQVAEDRLDAVKGTR
jgi:hypothetical protein